MNLKKWLPIGVLALAIFAFPILSAGWSELIHTDAALAATDSETSQHLISVNGKGTISVSPDIAYVTLGIETRANTAEKAQKDNASSFEKLQSTLLEDFNLDKKDIKTTSFYVQPFYSYENNSQKLKGYITTHMIQVKYRDLDNLGKMLDALSKSGANRINGIQMDTEKRQEYELEAIKNAMANAESKAKVIAEYAGKTLKEVVQVSQDTSSYPGGGPIYYSEMKTMDSATSISEGQIDITTTVHVQYEF